MTDSSKLFEDEELRELYDVEAHVATMHNGILVENPYPRLAELRAASPVQEGSVLDLLGVPGNGILMAPELPHFTALSYEANETVLRDGETYSSLFQVGRTTPIFGHTILEMVGEEHRRNRVLVQPAFTPKKQQWWIDRWIERIAAECIAAFENRGRADLNMELCAPLPLQTITNSFGLSADDSIVFRRLIELMHDLEHSEEERGEAGHEIANMIMGIISDRRANPQDDLISLLITTVFEEDGQQQVLSDLEILSFSRLILTAGSGTTWRQLGITFVALLSDPDLWARVAQDRRLIRKAVDESVRWEPTDPIFRRLVTKDTSLCGVDIPAGSVLDMCLGAANRDPDRWESPDNFDIDRKSQVSVGFGGGPHICLGMHLARAEITVAVNALLDRIPNLRLDPQTPKPRIVGLEHRGPTAVPVVF